MNMEQNNYHCSITAHVTPAEAYTNIANVAGWWAKSFKGEALKQNDTFSVSFGETTVDFEITEATPGNKVVWLVTECHLPWLKDKKEWKGTSVVWEITREDDMTKVDMTHVGLHPDVECFNACQKGWDGHIAGSLLQLMTKGVGKPQ